MDDDRPTTAELLEAWRDTTRAAELAERLARLAADAAEQADQNAAEYEQIAEMADAAKVAAERAASNARKAASEARYRARQTRDVRLREANQTVTDARASEGVARDRYQHGDRAAEGMTDR